MTYIKNHYFRVRSILARTQLSGRNVNYLSYANHHDTRIGLDRYLSRESGCTLHGSH